MPLSAIDHGSAQAQPHPRAFALGLATQISSPKTAIVYASIFSAMLASAPSWAMFAALVPVIFAIEFGWYALVAVAFSAEGA